MERYIRSFSLTADICSKLDRIPNKSAWLRELLRTVIVDKTACVIDRDEVAKMIDQRLSMIQLPFTPNYPISSDIVDVDQELASILGLTNPAVAE